MHAAMANGAAAGWAVGDHVTGTYLSQRFKGDVIACSQVKPGWFRLELRLDKAIDVVTSEHFSNLRKRIRGVVGPKGHTIEKTSDGQPHLQVDLEQ